MKQAHHRRADTPHDAPCMERSALRPSCFWHWVIVGNARILGRLNSFGSLPCGYGKGSLNLKRRKGAQGVRASGTRGGESPGNTSTSWKTLLRHCFRIKVFGDFSEPFPGPEPNATHYCWPLLSPRQGHRAQMGRARPRCRLWSCGGWSTQKTLDSFVISASLAPCGAGDRPFSWGRTGKDMWQHCHS